MTANPPRLAIEGRTPAAVAGALERLAAEASDPETGALFLRAAEVLTPATRRPGRAAIGDEASLIAIAVFNAARRRRGEPPNDRAAARHVVRALAVQGASDPAAEDRLRRKYRARRAELEQAIRIKSQKVPSAPAATSVSRLKAGESLPDRPRSTKLQGRIDEHR